MPDISRVQERADKSTRKEDKMNKLRIDNVTRKMYTHDNIPVGRICQRLTGRELYKIFEQNAGHPDDSWSDGRIIGAWAIQI